MEELIREVIGLLDTIEVRGKGNMNKLLACIQVLEKIAKAMQHNREEMSKAQQTVEEGGENDG